MNRMMIRLLGSAALMLILPITAHAQTEVTDERTTTLNTSQTGDLTITTTGAIRPTAGSAIIVDSDSDLTMGGTVEINDQNDVAAIDIQTGNSGDIAINGIVRVLEDFTPEDTDDDNIADGAFAQGSGRTGILISGASTFTGNLTSAAGSSVQVEGNDSQGVRLAEGATLDGNVSLAGNINVIGSRAVALDLSGTVTGDVSVAGNVTAQGEDAQAILVSNAMAGNFENSAAINNTGYRFASRPSLLVRDLVDEDDLRQAGAAVQINGSVGGGVFFRQVEEQRVDADGEPVLTDDGDPIFDVVARSSVNQAGGAPAILIDGEGTPIAIGIVAEITDMSDPDFDEDLQYAFINQGDMVASGIYDDVNATIFEARNATFEGGLSNTGTMTATTFRSGDDGTDDVDGFTGRARVIVFGDSAIADRLNNSGIIAASVSEAADVIYADRDAIIPARALEAVAIDISATAELAEINNAGTITALLSGRDGVAVVVRDASGTLSTITNTGIIAAIGLPSDTTGSEATDFNLIAFDLSNNTVGVNLIQEENTELDVIPRIDGDILLGSGNDTITLTQGEIIGAIDFGAGADSFSVANGEFEGAITDADGTLVLAVNNSEFTVLGSQPVNVQTASLDGATTFRPSIDGQAGTASTLVASGDLSIGSDVRVTPVLESLVGNGLTRFAIAQGGSLSFNGDVSALGEGFSPFLYDTVYSVDPATNTLFVDLQLRSSDDLGLDNVQADAFAATFEALGANDSLAASVINITNGEVFNAAYNQLLPEFAAAARQFVLANVDGAVGAVGSQLDAARNGQAKPGGLWFQEFAYFADRSRAGFSEQYRGQGFGFTGGVDTALGPFHAVGLNIGFASTEIEDTVGIDEPLDIVTAQLGAYAGFETGGFSLDAYGGYGFNSFDSNRLVQIGNFAGQASGDWNGTHINGSLRAGYDVPISGRFWARPTVSLDYLSLTEEAYTEDGTVGFALDLDERTVDTAAVSALLNLGAEFQGKRTWVRPTVRFGYRQEFGDDVITSGRFAGMTTPFLLEAEPFPDQGLLVGLSVTAGSGYSSFGFDLDSDIRDGFIRHTGRVVVRILF
jgi:hypothetical protein